MPRATSRPASGGSVMRIDLGQREGRDRQQEHALAPDPVRELAEAQHRGHERQHVAAEEEGHDGVAEPEPVLVERDQGGDQAGAEREQDEHRPGAPDPAHRAITRQQKPPRSRGRRPGAGRGRGRPRPPPRPRPGAGPRAPPPPGAPRCGRRSARWAGGGQVGHQHRARPAPRRASASSGAPAQVDPRARGPRPPGCARPGRPPADRGRRRSPARARGAPRPGRAGPSRSRRRPPARAGEALDRLQAHRRGGVAARAEALPRGLHQLAHARAGRGGGRGSRRYQPATMAAGGSGQPGTSASGARGEGAARERRRGQLGRGARRADQSLLVHPHRLERAELGEGGHERRLAGACTRSPAGSGGAPLTCAPVDPTAPPSEPARRAAAAQRAVAALPLDERLALRRPLPGGARGDRRGGRGPGGRRDGPAAPLRPPRAGLGAGAAGRPAASSPRRSVRARCRPPAGRPQLEWAPYGVVLGWHAANSPVWVPTVVAASALVAGNALPGAPREPRPAHHRARRSRPWPGPGRRTRSWWSTLPGPEAEPLVWDPGVHAVVAHASTATCKRHLAGLGRAYAAGAPLRPYIAEGSGNDPLIVLAGADLERGGAGRGARRLRQRRPALHGGQADDRGAGGLGRFPPAPGGGGRRAAARRPRRRGDRRRPAARGPGAGAAPGRPSPRRRQRGGEVVVGEGERGDLFTPTIVRLPREALDVRPVAGGELRPAARAGGGRGRRGRPGARQRHPLRPRRGGLRRGPGARERVVAGLRAARVLVDEGPLYQDPHLVVGGVGDSGTAGARPKIEQLVFARRVHRGGRARPARAGAASG